MRKTIIVIILAMMIIGGLPVKPAHGAIDNFEISLAGEDPRFSGGYPIIVAGIWHNLDFSLPSTSNNVTVFLYEGSALPTVKNETNFYQFHYDGSTWEDLEYSDYISPTNCALLGSLYSFYIGLHATAVEGSWTLEIFSNGVEEHSSIVLVEMPRAGISFSGPSFYFDIEPYQSISLSTYDPADSSGSSYFTTSNTGNIPMEFEFTYDIYDNLLSTSNSTGIRHLGEQSRHYIDLQAQAWSPREFTIKGIITGEPNMLVTPETTAYILSPTASFNIILKVARPDFEIFQMDGLVVQYKSMVMAEHNDEVDLDLYVTGTNDSHLSVSTTDLTLIKIFKNDVETLERPVYVSFSEDVETHLLVTIECSESPSENQVSMMAYVHYKAETDDTQIVGFFNTSMVVRISTTDDTTDDTVDDTTDDFDDVDDDDMDDAWEEEYFDDTSQTGSDDFDNDTFDNLEEFEANTDPTDPDDFPADDDDDDVADDEGDNDDESSEEAPGFELMTILVATIIAFTLITFSRRRK